MNQSLFNENIKSFDLKSIYGYVEGKYGVVVVNSVKEYLKIDDLSKVTRGKLGSL